MCAEVLQYITIYLLLLLHLILFRHGSSHAQSFFVFRFSDFELRCLFSSVDFFHLQRIVIILYVTACRSVYWTKAIVSHKYSKYVYIYLHNRYILQKDI